MPTEAEAREKWCPHARILVHVELGASVVFGTVNIWGDDDTRTPCIASECMMWEWVGIRNADGSHDKSQAAAEAAEFGQLNPDEAALGDCGRKRRAP